MASTRFDFTKVGSGLGFSDFNKGAWAFDRYASLTPGTPGYDHGVAATQYLIRKGIDPRKATPKQKWTALDWRFRDIQRGNQKENSFGSTVLGKALGVAAPIAGSFFGPTGAALGGAIGGGVRGGLKGAALGAGLGFAAAKALPMNRLGLGGAAAPTGSVAGRALNAALPGTFGAGTPALSAGSGALGLGTGASIGAGLGAGALLGGAATAAGGKGVGILSNLFGDIAGDVVGGLIGGFGNDRAADQFERAAQNSQLIVNPSPFQGRSLFINSNAQGQAGLTPFGETTRGRLATLQNQTFNRTQFNRENFRDRLLEAANRVNDSREKQAFNSLESKLFNRTGASTGTQRQIADFRSDIEDRRTSRALQAEIAADQFQRNRIGDFGQAFGFAGNLDDRFRAQQGQNLQGAQFLAPFGINNPTVGAAGAFRAQTTQDFFNGLAGTIGGLTSAGLSAAGNPFQPAAAPAPSGGGFFNPGAINFGADPLASLGF